MMVLRFPVQSRDALRELALQRARSWLRREANGANFSDATHALRVLQAVNSAGHVPLHPTTRTWLERHAVSRRWPIVQRWAALLLDEITAAEKGNDKPTCDVHDLPSEGLVKHLHDEMHRRHANGDSRGIKICRGCRDRALDANRKQG